MYTVYLLANENNYCLRFSLERAKLTNLLEAGSFLTLLYSRYLSVDMKMHLLAVLKVLPLRHEKHCEEMYKTFLWDFLSFAQGESGAGSSSDQRHAVRLS